VKIIFSRDMNLQIIILYDYFSVRTVS